MSSSWANTVNYYSKSWGALSVYISLLEKQIEHNIYKCIRNYKITHHSQPESAKEVCRGRLHAEGWGSSLRSRAVSLKSSGDQWFCNWTLRNLQLQTEESQVEAEQATRSQETKFELKAQTRAPLKNQWPIQSFLWSAFYCMQATCPEGGGPLQSKDSGPC